MTAVTATSKKPKKSLERQPIGYLFIAPNFFIYITFVFIPIFWTMGLSLTNYDLNTMEFVGLQNFIGLFSDRIFLKSLWNTMRYTIMVLPLGMVIGLMLAMLIQKKFIGRAFFRAVFYLPQVISLVASSLAWMYLFGENGILNMLLRTMGVSRIGWLTDPSISIFSIVVLSLWMISGYNMLLFLSGLQSIPSHLYEAAAIDGATPIQSFFNITLPQLAPTTFFVFVMSCISSFQVFGQVYMMTGGGPDNATTTLAHQIYINAFQYYKMGYASAMSVILLLIILLITLVNFRYGNKEVD